MKRHIQYERASRFDLDCWHCSERLSKIDVDGDTLVKGRLMGENLFD